MKYIKLLELFSIKDCYPYKNIPTVNPSYVIYNFSTDNYIYDVEFERLKEQYENKLVNLEHSQCLLKLLELFKFSKAYPHA